MIHKVPTWEVEQSFWQCGIKYIIGMDEVGRGCIAGPVVVGAVIFKFNNIDFDFSMIRDSKDLNTKNRLIISQQIIENAFKYSIGTVSNTSVDLHGITWAVHHAAIQAMNKLKVSGSNCFVITDNRLLCPKYPFPIKYESIIDGDSICMSIASASIIAKVWRDNYMQKLAVKPQYQKYGWDTNVGYGTLDHRNSIRQHGISDLHRKSFCKHYSIE